jgi:hypothetical protein
MGSDANVENPADVVPTMATQGTPCVEGEVELRAEELQRAVWDMPENRWVRRILLLFAVGIFAFASYRGHAGGGARGASLFVAPLVFLAVLLVLLRWQLRRRLRNDSTGTRHLRFRFDPEGYAIEMPNASANIKYRALVRFVESPTALLLYTQSNFAQVLPKRALSAADLDQVRAWLKVGVTPQKSSPSPKRIFVMWALLIVAFIGIWQLLSIRP